MLNFSGIRDLLEPDRATNAEVHLVVPLGQMLLQQIPKGGYGLFQLSGMERTEKGPVYVADAVIPAPADVLPKQATDEFRAEVTAAAFVLSQRKAVRRKHKSIDSSEVPEILDLFTPKSKKARLADALSSPKSV